MRLRFQNVAKLKSFHNGLWETQYFSSFCYNFSFLYLPFTGSLLSSWSSSELKVDKTFPG